MKNFLTGLPTKTEEEIHRHIGWFLEYKSLLAKKKEAIQKWRQKKDVSTLGSYYVQLYHAIQSP